jgi:hypothetical protein
MLVAVVIAVHHPICALTSSVILSANAVPLKMQHSNFFDEIIQNVISFAMGSIL